MQIIDHYLDLARSRPSSVVLPEGGDVRVLKAASQLKNEGISQPLILGKPEELEAAATRADIDLSELQTIDPTDNEHLDAFSAAYATRRGLRERIAIRMVRRPLVFGGMMVAEGLVDTMVAGVATATGTVIQAGALTVGFAPGIETISSFFLMILPEFQGQQDHLLIFADCAVTINPTASELADIACTSAASAAKLLTDEPRIALLSFSSKGSAAHPDVEKLTDALSLIKARDVPFLIDGEFQADTALMASVAQKKLADPGDVAGRANVLIFPDLDAANIGYKLTQYLAGAKAIGPFLQGFARPISDLSRGASVEDIVATTAITLALASP